MNNHIVFWNQPSSMIIHNELDRHLVNDTVKLEISHDIQKDDLGSLSCCGFHAKTVPPEFAENRISSLGCH